MCTQTGAENTGHFRATEFSLPWQLSCVLMQHGRRSRLRLALSAETSKPTSAPTCTAKKNLILQCKRCCSFVLEKWPFGIKPTLSKMVACATLERGIDALKGSGVSHLSLQQQPPLWSQMTRKNSMYTARKSVPNVLSSRKRSMNNYAQTNHLSSSVRLLP